VRLASGFDTPPGRADQATINRSTIAPLRSPFTGIGPPGRYRP
jgi:hypothetical protein